MPQGEKSSYSPKQKRKAEHIEEGYEERGVWHEEAERRAWATVNKQDGGARGPGAKRKSMQRVEQHVAEEEGELFPLVEEQMPKTLLDLVIGMQQLEEELVGSADDLESRS